MDGRNNEQTSDHRAYDPLWVAGLQSPSLLHAIQGAPLHVEERVLRDTEHRRQLTLGAAVVLARHLHR